YVNFLRRVRLTDGGRPSVRLNAREHRARAAPTTSTLATIDHRATSLGPRCAIATSTATSAHPPTIDHRPSRRSLGPRWTRPAHLRNFPPKKNLKRARLPTSRHPGEPIGTGVAIAVRILATGHWPNVRSWGEPDTPGWRE